MVYPSFFYPNFFRNRLGFLLLLGVTLLYGCQGSEPSDVAEQSPVTLESIAEFTKEEVSAPESIKVAEEDSETSNSIELLYGKWSPVSYITPEGSENDLTGLSDAEKAEFSWEFTPEGLVISGNREGWFSVDGNTIAIENMESGEITEFQFSVSDNELAIVSDNRSTLKLIRETP